MCVNAALTLALQTSSFDCTPSPSKTPVENPLNIMLDIVKQETEESCIIFST